MELIKTKEELLNKLKKSLDDKHFPIIFETQKKKVEIITKKLETIKDILINEKESFEFPNWDCLKFEKSFDSFIIDCSIERLQLWFEVLCTLLRENVKIKKENNDFKECLKNQQDSQNVNSQKIDHYSKLKNRIFWTTIIFVTLSITIIVALAFVHWIKDKTWDIFALVGIVDACIGGIGFIIERVCDHKSNLIYEMNKKFTNDFTDKISEAYDNLNLMVISDKSIQNIVESDVLVEMFDKVDNSVSIDNSVNNYYFYMTSTGGKIKEQAQKILEDCKEQHSEISKALENINAFLNLPTTRSKEIVSNIIDETEKIVSFADENTLDNIEEIANTITEFNRNNNESNWESMLLLRWNIYCRGLYNEFTSIYCENRKEFNSVQKYHVEIENLALSMGIAISDEDFCQLENAIVNELYPSFSDVERLANQKLNSFFESMTNESISMYMSKLRNNYTKIYLNQMTMQDIGRIRSEFNINISEEQLNYLENEIYLILRPSLKTCEVKARNLLNEFYNQKLCILLRKECED